MDSAQKILQLEESLRQSEERVRQLTQVQRRDSQLLQERQHFAERLIDTSPDCIYVYDVVAFKLIYSNHPVGKSLGYSKEQLDQLGEAMLQSMMHPDDARRLPELFGRWATARDGEILEHEFRLKNSQGYWRWLCSRETVFSRNDEGRVAQILGTASDITLRKQAEDEAHKARESAEAANQEKDQFLAALSHELRTPLAPVLTGVQLLEADTSTPEHARESLSMIRRNIELEARLIDDILDLSRVSRGKLDLHFLPTNVHDNVQQVIDICQSDLRLRQLYVELKLSAARPVVRADPARIQQVIWNLLKNAIKFSEARGQITIRSENTSDGGLALMVEDSGIGIDPKMLTRIFNAFEQGSPDVTRIFGGLGLGLSISKALVELHKGTLTAHSEGTGRGAVFTLTLPNALVQHNATPAKAPDNSIAAPTGARVLLVEDHADTLKTMKRLLTSFGCDVVTAANVTDAMKASDNQRFDLLLSDIGLPDGSGLDLMRHVHLKHRLKGIALSGFGMEQDIQKSLEAGFIIHLTKPIDINKLEGIIRKTLGKQSSGV